VVLGCPAVRRRAGQCAAVRQYGTVWQCAAVHAAVCGTARGSVWQCVRQCAAVRQCTRQRAVVQRCGRVRQYSNSLLCITSYTG
jgi:hypothetical protein